MLGLPWEKVAKITEDDIDIDSADYYCDLFLDANVEDWKDNDKLKHVFQLMQVLLNLKWEQLKLVETSLSDRNGEISNLKDQIKELEHENKDLQKAVSASGLDSESIIETRKLEFTVVKLNSELESLRIAKDISFKEKEELLNDKCELERKMELLSKENKELLERCEYLHLQLQDRPSFFSKSNDEANYRKEISSLRAKLRVQKAEIDWLEDEKQSLWNDVQLLENSLRQAGMEIDRATDDYVKMKEALTETDKIHAEKTAECNMLRDQVADLSHKICHPEDTNDFIMNVVEQKVEEWNEILSDKDMEIVKLNEQIKKLTQELCDLKADSDKASVQALMQSIKDRNIQIQSLKKQLTDATAEVERSTILLDELTKQINENGSTSGGYKSEHIVILKKQLQEKDNQNIELAKRLKMAEEAAQSQANEVTVLEKRLKRYEDGEYGLSEAISELKATKLQLNSKERQLEEICRLASHAESSLNEVHLENEHLRSKLGIPLNKKIDLNGYRRHKRVKDEEECAVNIVLQKEIEKLEDERLELKRKLRTLARQLGQQYGSIDSHVDGVLLGNLIRADDEAGSVKRARTVTVSPSSQKLEFSAVKDELIDLPEVWKTRLNLLDEELVQAKRQIEEEYKKQDKLETRLKQITEANILLENGLKEIQKQIYSSHTKSKEYIDSGKQTKQKKPNNMIKTEEKRMVNNQLETKNEIIQLECPSLDKLLAVLDTRNLIEDVDSERFLKSRVDQLEGANQELRSNLRDTRLSNVKYEVKLNRAHDRIKQLEAQLRSLDILDKNETSRTVLECQQFFQKDVNPDTAEIVVSLEEHLLTTMKDIDDKNKQLAYLDNEMKDLRKKFSVCRHRQGLLYRDFYGESQMWKKEKEKLEQRLERSEIRVNELEVYESELLQLQNNLSSLCTSSNAVEEVNGNSAMKQTITEQSRQLLLLRVNEASLRRRYLATQEREAALSKENTSLKSELIHLESAMSVRLNYYARYKETAEFQIQKLQKTLDHCVSEDELNNLRNEYETLAIKYRKLLEQDSEFANYQLALKSAQTNLDTLKKQHDDLKQQLTIEKEQRYALENSVGQLQSNSITSANHMVDNLSDTNIAKRFALIEMKELNERERANHALIILNTVQDANHQLELRNKELESKFIETTKSLIEFQETEQKLRQELAKAVPLSVHQETEIRNTELEEINLKLRHEIEQLKEVALISMNQQQNFENKQNSQLIEIQNLREQMAELESKDDSKANLARLHRLVTRMQISESTALRRLASMQVKVNRLESDLLKVEKRLTHKQNKLTNMYDKSRERERRLRETITTLRQRYAGCISLKQQEKLSVRLNEALRQCISSQLALDEAVNAKIKAESINDAYEEKKKLTAEIQNMLTEYNKQHTTDSINKHFEKKVLEWQERLSDLRISESKQRRQVERLKEQVRYLESLTQNQERQLKELELENCRLVKELDQRETQWEQREAELEGALEHNTIPDNIVTESINELKSIPDLLMNEDMEAVSDQFNHQDEISKCMQLNSPHQSSECFNESIHNCDNHMLSKLKNVNTTLRKRLCQLIQFIRLQDLKVQNVINHSLTMQNPDIQSTLAGLRTNIELLQRRLNGKDESLARVNELLKQAYEANEKSNDRHRQEIAVLQNKLQNKMEEQMLNLAQKVESVNQYETSDIHLIELKKRLKEFEESLNEQNQALFRQVERTKVIQQECDLWQLKYNQLQTKNETLRTNMENMHRQEIMDLTSQTERLQKELDECHTKLNESDNEIKRWKAESCKSPSVMQRQLTERLRSDLFEKDKQIKVLSKALRELRQDLVAQAEQAVLATDVIQSVQHAPPMQEVKESKTVYETATIPVCVKPTESVVRSQSAKQNYDIKVQKDTEKMTKFEESNKNSELECKQLNERLEHIKCARLLSSPQVKINELVRKNRILEEENNRLRMIPEKPYQEVDKYNKDSQMSSEGRTSLRNEWEARKRLEAEVNKLKEQLTEKCSEVTSIQKQLNITKSALDRTNKENKHLREKVNEVWGPGAILDEVNNNNKREQNKNQDLSHTSISNISERVELHQQVQELQSEVERLRRAQRTLAGLPPGTKSMNTDAMLIERAEMRNKLLSKRVEELEKQLLDKGFVSSTKLQLEQAIQRDLLRLNNENIELKFELETLRSDASRYKTRVHDLQVYVNLLKQEKETLRSGQNLNNSFNSDSSTMSTIKRIGESGKSPKELEKIIVCLKKVLKRCQAENERLKCAPGPVSHNELQQYKIEIKRLQNELETAQLTVGSKLFNHRVANEQGIAKLMHEYDSLRKNYEEVSL
ncbi:Centrosomal protein [Schistosoma japonicum]|uniref:Centrosomal protein n=1 Tax=Schistosoma japonicum TaxID=6182 RepID=A0A4Z2DMI7_SCHJA|nr:Centrosomal protein [Schistosoma japonicum]